MTVLHYSNNNLIIEDNKTNWFLTLPEDISFHIDFKTYKSEIIYIPHTEKGLLFVSKASKKAKATLINEIITNGRFFL